MHGDPHSLRLCCGQRAREASFNNAGLPRLRSPGVRISPRHGARCHGQCAPLWCAPSCSNGHSRCSRSGESRRYPLRGLGLGRGKGRFDYHAATRVRIDGPVQQVLGSQGRVDGMSGVSSGPPIFHAICNFHVNIAGPGVPGDRDRDLD